jgi:uncharacterized protein
MTELWISLKDIPAEGQEYTFTDQSLWTGPMKEYRVPGRIVRPFEASVSITPQDEGFLVRGSFSGVLALPCSRCAEEFELPVEGEFDGFEEVVDVPEAEDESRLRVVKGAPELDIAGVLWEQFVLALPERPLCDEQCRGLCPACGRNRNQGDCGCAKDQGDPRLAVLRNLKLS